MDENGIPGTDPKMMGQQQTQMDLIINRIIQNVALQRIIYFICTQRSI